MLFECDQEEMCIVIAMDDRRSRSMIAHYWLRSIRSQRWRDQHPRGPALFSIQAGPANEDFLRAAS